MGQHMSAQLHAVGLCQGQEHLLKSDTPCKDVKHLSQVLLLPASQQYCQPLTAGFLPLFWAHWRIHAHKILVPHIHSTPQGSPFSCRCRYGCTATASPHKHSPNHQDSLPPAHSQKKSSAHSGSDLLYRLLPGAAVTPKLSHKGTATYINTTQGFR